MTVNTLKPLREPNGIHRSRHQTPAEMDQEAWPSISRLPFPAMARPPAGFPVDVYEGEDSLIVRAALPGVAPEDVAVYVNGEFVSIRAIMKRPYPLEEGECYQQEISYGVMSRTMLLPGAVDIQRAEGVMRQGMITLTLPRAHPSARHSIKVRAEATRDN